MAIVRSTPPRGRLFRTALLKRTARIATGSSAVRGQGPGVGAAAAEFLAGLDLRRFVTARESTFRRRLDSATRGLQRHLPIHARKFGLARKLLNIYLRDVRYNAFLCPYYDFVRIEYWLELPLDSITGKRLRARYKRLAPRWTTIRALTPEASGTFQELARRLAREEMKEMPRVHLDTFWWGARNE